MTTNQTRVGQQRPGGRAARVRASVLEAVSALLAEVGYEQMTIEDVATRAGVHKTTVYRRWPTKADLVLDTARTSSDQNIPIPDTGSFQEDLQQLARSVVSNINASPDTTRAIVAAAAASTDLASFMHRFWAERLAASAVIVEQAIARGELTSSTDANLIIETLIGPLWVRLLLTGEPIDDALADNVAKLVAKGASV